MALCKASNETIPYVGNNPIGEAYKGNILLFSAEYIILDGVTSNAGSPSIVNTDASETHNTGLGDGAWYLVADGRVVAALANKVNFTGYSKLWFRVAENKVFDYASLGYRTDGKAWINAAGVSVNTRVDLTRDQTGDFYVDIASGDTGGYIHIEQMTKGTGISAGTLRISKIWLE